MMKLFPIPRSLLALMRQKVDSSLTLATTYFMLIIYFKGVLMKINLFKYPLTSGLDFGSRRLRGTIHIFYAEKRRLSIPNQLTIHLATSVYTENGARWRRLHFQSLALKRATEKKHIWRLT
ncbi:hypothetical protein Pfo_000650 [Paulownia fortunei]|nr:hypothetical protein Pfo_000650 [Paulownia fortunei]